MTKFFRINKKPYFGVTFAQRDFFLKPLTMYSCRCLTTFKSQGYRVHRSSKQKLFYHYQHAKIVQSICSIRQIICEIHLIYEYINLSYKASPFFDYVHLIINKVTFSFPEFVSACKKSAHFINSFLKYSKF